LLKSQIFYNISVLSVLVWGNPVRYDMIYLRALKSWRYGQYSLAHGTETKNKERTKRQKPVSSEETVWAKVRECSPGGRSETTFV